MPGPSAPECVTAAHLSPDEGRGVPSEHTLRSQQEDPAGVPAPPPFEAAVPPAACLLGCPPCPSTVQLGATFALFPVLSPELSTGPGTLQALSVHNIYRF